METCPRGRRIAAEASRWGLNGGFDLRGRPFFLSPGVLADKRAVLVELNVLVAVVHQAVSAVGRFDLPAQRALAALQWLLIVVTAREPPDLPSLRCGVERGRRGCGGGRHVCVEGGRRVCGEGRRVCVEGGQAWVWKGQTCVWRGADVSVDGADLCVEGADVRVTTSTSRSLIRSIFNIDDAHCKKYSLTIRLLHLRICYVMSLPGVL